MLEDKKINRFYVESSGWVYIEDNASIEIFYMPGEMANIPWIRVVLSTGETKEYNTKFISEIVYEQGCLTEEIVSG